MSDAPRPSADRPAPMSHVHIHVRRLLSPPLPQARKALSRAYCISQRRISCASRPAQPTRRHRPPKPAHAKRKRKREPYSTAIAPPNTHAAMTPESSPSCVRAPSTARQPGAATPFAEAGNVVAKPTVGLGPPETVTVAAAETGVGRSRCRCRRWRSAARRRT